MNSDQKVKFETVLVMQGGGSLGAYECGVYKALAKHEIKFDVVAGTSIGAINAAVIVGTRNDDPARDLEDFWLTLAEKVTPTFLPDGMRAIFSATYAATWGNPNAFTPKWLMPSIDYFFPHMWSYLYDIAPLKNTLTSFVDFTKLNNPARPRLIVTSTDIRNSEPVTFDSNYMNIDADHLLASAGFPFYGIKWTEKDGRYLWDGSLLSNTPLREVINASPQRDKKVYIVNLFPRKHDELPISMAEVLHRARDIMHTDKTYHNVKMSKIISRYLILLKEMHDIIMHFFDNQELENETKERILKIEPEYHKLACERGAIIKEIIRIERREESHFLFEDADFSVATVKQLIRQGQDDAENILAKKK
ncbi:MAG: patatin-like phospholipase family protein [Nitrososphaerales archaeon]